FSCWCVCLRGFDVKCSRHTPAFLGSSVVLPCYIIEPLPVDDLEVEWRRADAETLVHLYQDGESRTQQEYHDRAHFFSDQIQHGNFSLRLDNLRVEDEGQYLCTVNTKKKHVISAESKLIPRLQGKSTDKKDNLLYTLYVCFQKNIMYFLPHVIEI
uniref:Ig-like domain-containing protein n=1 Tax=Sinocyclocheilus grahami TaxID=75366 RepID=A0A672PVY1_SINGR